jgi:surfeit locus 1 family protein
MPNLLSKFHRPKAVAWFFFILAFGTCMVAGGWQVKRLQWKEALIAQIAQANAIDPIRTLPREPEALAALQFHTITLTGTWRPTAEFHIAPRYWRDKFGYAIVTPFKLTDGRTLLVNRGWVPAAKKLPETRPETRVRGMATITGLVRVGAERSYFTPVSQPEKNIWFGRDVADMAASAKLSNVVPAMVDLVGTQDVNRLPIPSDGTIRLRNDHLSYVITWWGIALGILVIFVLYHRKNPR